MTDVEVEDVVDGGAQAQGPADGRGVFVADEKGDESDSGGLGDQSAAPAGDGDEAAAGKPGRKVAIIGTAPNWQEAPFGDPSWEIWGLSRLYKQLPRWNVWFELHPIPEMARTWEAGNEELEAKARQEYVEWLGAQDKPVLVHPEVAQVIPNTTPYPTDAIERTFNRGYFTNTVSWMIALAIAEGVTEIGLWGVDMALSDEYEAQRPSVEYFIGIAEGAGIRVWIPDTSDLCKTRSPYALRKRDAYEQKIQAKWREMKQNKAQVDADVRKGQLISAHIAGALEILEFVESRWK